MPTIRVSELIGRHARDSADEDLGVVQDVVVLHTRDGGYEVIGLIIGRGSVAGRWGYGGSLDPPPVLGRLLRLLRRHERYLRWDHIAELERHTVRAAVRAGEIGRNWSDPDPA